MKIFTNKTRLLSIAGILIASVMASQSAQAASTFNSSVAVTYTINSIVNRTGESDDLSGLSVIGDFFLNTDFSFIDKSSDSDAVVTPFSAIANETVDPVIGSYTKTVAVNGSATQGTTSAVYVGEFSLIFENSSANEFEIEVALDYVLSASVSGLFAESTIQLDYFNEDGSFASGIAGHNTSASYPFNADSSISSVAERPIYTFMLGAVQSDALYVDAAISSSIAPIPVPGAFGLFATGLLVPVLRRFKQSLS